MGTKKIVITGGPGTGKTSMIQRLEDMGFKCLPEISRTITFEARAQGTEWLFLEDPILFSRQILEGRIAQFDEATKMNSEKVFFDRGLPDVVAYLDSVGQDYDTSFVNACKDYRYDQIFLLPPWKEIYTPDEGRYENYEEGLRVYDYLERSYRNFGYDPMPIPKTTVEQRVDFIIKNLEK